MHIKGKYLKGLNFSLGYWLEIRQISACFLLLFIDLRPNVSK